MVQRNVVEIRFNNIYSKTKIPRKLTLFSSKMCRVIETHMHIHIYTQTIYENMYTYIQENHSSLYLLSWNEIIFKPTFLFGFDIVFPKIHILSLHIHFLSSITDKSFPMQISFSLCTIFFLSQKSLYEFSICILMSTLHSVLIPSALYFKVYLKMFSVNTQIFIDIKPYIFQPFIPNC